MTQYTQIGFTKKTHGIRGELKLTVEDAYEDLLLESDRIFLEIRGSKQPFFIEHLRGGGELIVKFEDVDSREDALLLQSRGIFLPSSEIPEMETDDSGGLEYGRIVGYRIVDRQAGEIGTVEEVLEMPQQEMALVLYEGREVLIPLNPDFVKNIDDEATQVAVDLPEGLLSL